MNIIRNICATVLLGGTVVFGLASSATATTAVPANFEPGSVSFPSTTRGFLLGTSPCSHAPCTALLTSTDAGRTWAGVPVPHVPFTSPSSSSSGGVSHVAFANASDGWVYGPSLWATRNGAQTWAQVNLGGPVFSLAASAHVVYAVVGSCFPNGSSCQRPALSLERAAVGSGNWGTVRGISGYGTSALLAVNGNYAWVALTPKKFGAELLWTTSDGGTKWRSLPDTCYQPSQAADLAGLASPGGNVVFELCAGNPGAGQEGKSVRLSSNGGTTSHLVSRLPLGGIAGAITTTGNRNVFVTAASGASDVYSSDNAGQTWATRTFNDGGAGLYDLHFTTPSFGAAIEGQPQLGPSADRLLLTTDGGATWSPVQS
jgi:photosystem II stability/assembly factor-like uncharacterized protein